MEHTCESFAKKLSFRNSLALMIKRREMNDFYKVTSSGNVVTVTKLKEKVQETARVLPPIEELEKQLSSMTPEEQAEFDAWQQNANKTRSE